MLAPPQTNRDNDIIGVGMADTARCGARNHNNDNNDNNGFRLATRAARPPEMCSAAMRRCAEAIEENDRPGPGRQQRWPNNTGLAPFSTQPPADAWSEA